jgi:hypothetical protein
VLARIIQERGLSKTNLGIMAITCAAADDVTAWCILAGVIAIVKAGNISGALLTFVLSIGYVGFMLYVVQPFLKRVGSIYVSRENLNKTVVAFVFLLLLLSSYLTEIIGIHALFGAFLAGVVMPQNFNFKKLIAEKVEDISLVLLLPLFFVLTGLRTQIGLLNEGSLWLICGLVILVAVIGKFGGSALAARLVGQSWKDSLSIGALMNTRGLMELVVLNIGYDLGILSPEIFAIMVLMALATTLMTSPLLTLINKIFTTKSNLELEEARPGLDTRQKVLISFGAPKMGSTLLRLASQLSGNAGKEVKFVGLHISPESALKPQDAIMYEKESFAPIKSTAHELKIDLITKYKNSSDVQRQIVKTTRKGQYDMLLVGGAKDLFSRSQTGGKIKNFLHESSCTVGVLIDNGFKNAQHVLVLVTSNEDMFLVRLARQFVSSDDVQVQIMNASETEPGLLVPGHPDYPMHEHITVINHRQLEPPFLKRFDLVMLSLAYWEVLDGSESEWTQYSPSILIVKPSEDTGQQDITTEGQVAVGI